MVFAGIVLAVVAVAAVSVPLIQAEMNRIYISLQTDVNKRQAFNIAEYLRARLRNGATEQEVVQDVAALLSHSNAQKGYSCVINSKTGEYLYHADSTVVGKNVATKNAFYTGIKNNIKDEPFQNIVMNRQQGEGILFYPKMDNNYHESVSVINLPDYDITISTHENIEQIRTALDALGDNIILAAAGIGFFVALLATWISRRISLVYEKRIEKERDKNDLLLRRALPGVVVDEINRTGSFAPKRYENTSVLFADISGFTELASEADPKLIISLLNSIFNRFDDLANQFGVEKIKTIGDNYMACVGSPLPQANHAEVMMQFAMQMLTVMAEINAKYQINVHLRIGINSGAIIGGVIGQSKYAFDIWGDTVNVASRMESTGVVDGIQVSRPTYELLKTKHTFEPRGKIEIKGKGLVECFIYPAKSVIPAH